MSGNCTVTKTNPGPTAKPGALDGTTVVRFAHAFDSGGGMERLLDDLDRSLLTRNRMSIIRIHIASDRTRLAETAEEIGRGRLIRIPLPLPAGQSVQLASDHERLRPTLRERIRDRFLYHPIVWKHLLRRVLLGKRLPRRRGQVEGAGTKIREIFGRFSVDLVILHFFGGADADEIVLECRKAGVAFVLQNHYANERFLHLSIRKHAELAAAVSGVNGLDVPAYLRERFTNLADGIDTDFFSRDTAVRPQRAPSLPILLLPARVVRPKGHWDLVQAAAELKSKGHRFVVAFAGRTDSAPFVSELRREVGRLALQNEVIFLGALPEEGLRNWYAAATVVAFPTYHHEGLGRVILEAQAMETPVVAYATGGVADGIVDGQGGHLVEKGDLTGLVSSLSALLSDMDRAREMGRMGRAFITERFSLHAAAKRHEEFYLKSIGWRCGGSGDGRDV